MHPNDLRQLAELIERGQFVPTAPAALGLYARDSSAQQFSSQSVNVPITDPAQGAGDSTFTKLFKLNASMGAPRTWHVRSSLSFASPPVYVPGLELRLRWSIGQNVDTADVDFRAGVTCFPITCESLEVMARAALDPAVTPVPPFVWSAQAQCAVSAYPLTADWRAPTRTVRLEVVPGNLFVDVPRHAQQCQVLCEGPVLLRLEATVPQNQGILTLDGFRLFDIPAGTARITVLTPPPVGSVMSFSFRLGL